MVKLLQQQLIRAQQRQKQHADKNRTERSFEVGDFVYLKLQPYVQTSVATRASHKLSIKYYGPYQIIAKVCNVAYKLLLLESASIHPVFHVSQHKKDMPPHIQVSPAVTYVNSDKFRFFLSKSCRDVSNPRAIALHLKYSYSGHLGQLPWLPRSWM
jgi:ribosomal protein L21E